jgi:glycosyltransferase involved in cell wall biosynthesis
LTDRPDLTIVVTTYNRPHLLPRAVRSALAQTHRQIEVIVVDDGSTPPVEVAEADQDARVSVLRLPANGGLSAARNAAATVARGRWITHLDDDDELLPRFAELSLGALSRATLPEPVAVVSGLQMVDARGDVIETHLPPTLARGSYFGLVEVGAGFSSFSKQTLVVERALLRALGGFDEALGALPYTELFLRLNPVCSILGLPVVTYRQLVHDGARLSRDPSRRRADHAHLVAKHRALFASQPRLLSALTVRHARALYAFGDVRGAIATLANVLRRDPLYGLRRVAPLVLRAALGRWPRTAARVPRGA